MKNDKTVVRVERERERESYNLINKLRNLALLSISKTYYKHE